MAFALRTLRVAERVNLDCTTSSEITNRVTSPKHLP